MTPFFPFFVLTLLASAFPWLSRTTISDGHIFVRSFRRRNLIRPAGKAISLKSHICALDVFLHNGGTFFGLQTRGFAYLGSFFRHSQCETCHVGILAMIAVECFGSFPSLVFLRLPPFLMTEAHCENSVLLFPPTCSRCGQVKRKKPWPLTSMTPPHRLTNWSPLARARFTRVFDAASPLFPAAHIDVFLLSCPNNRTGFRLFKRSHRLPHLATVFERNTVTICIIGVSGLARLFARSSAAPT